MNLQSAVRLVSSPGWIILIVANIGVASATDLTYVPINPSFGGNPINGSILLNSASATNKHTAPVSTVNASLTQTPLQQFNSMLERSILSQLASGAASKITAGGKLIPGTVETANFTITIIDLGGGVLRITTTDKATGLSTSFEVSQ